MEIADAIVQTGRETLEKVRFHERMDICIALMIMALQAIRVIDGNKERGA